MSSSDGPILVQIPDYNGKGGYDLQIVELKTIQDFSRLKGQAARFYMEPSTQNGIVHGEAPTIRYFKDTRGVIVAQDSLSLQLISLYYQFEQLMIMDQALGVKDLNKWPRIIAINPRYQGPDGGLVRNNALYAPSLDAYLFVPFTNNELPLAVNGGVIGHEHFHSIFNKAVVEPLKDKFPEDAVKDPYHTTLLRGINEGLADVWGWAFSDDLDFVGRSLSSERINRRLDFDPISILTAKTLKAELSFGRSGTSYAYQVGALLARSLYGVRQGLIKQGVGEIEIRTKIVQGIVASLPLLKDRIAKLEKDQLIAPAEVIAWVAETMTGEFKSGCVYLRDLIQEPEILARSLCQ